MSRTYQHECASGSRFTFRLPTMKDRNEAMTRSRKAGIQLQQAVERNQPVGNSTPASFETYLAAVCLEAIDGSGLSMTPEDILASDDIELRDFAEYDAFLSLVIFGDNKLNERVNQAADNLLEQLNGRGKPAASAQAGA